MRLVLDTNVVVLGLFWRGPPRRLLDLARDGRGVWFSSGVLLDELAGVLERDKFAGFLASREITATFLMQRYGMLAKMVRPERSHRAGLADDDLVEGEWELLDWTVEMMIFPCPQSKIGASSLARPVSHMPHTSMTTPRRDVFRWWNTFSSQLRPSAARSMITRCPSCAAHRSM